MLALSKTTNSILYSLNIRAKIFLSVCTSLTALFLSSTETLNILFVFSCCYAIISKKYRILLISYFFMLIMMAISIGCVMIISQYVQAVSSMATPSTAIIPFMRASCVMNTVIPLTLTIRASDLLSSLQSLRLPLFIYLPGAVMIRFVPAFLADIKQIYESMKIRGFEIKIKNIFFHPIIFIRLSFAPLIFMSLRSSEDLGIACELKRVGTGKITPYSDKPCKKADYTLMLFVLLLCIFLLFTEYSISGTLFKRGHI